MKHGKYRLPIDSLPEHIQKLSRKIKPGQDQKGLLTLLRAAWRDDTAPGDDNARIDDAFSCMRILGDGHMMEVPTRKVNTRGKLEL